MQVATKKKDPIGFTKAKRKCSSCLKPGHIARHCPNLGRTPAKADYRELSVYKKNKEVWKGRGNLPFRPAADKHDDGRVLTEGEFEIVKDLHDNDKNSMQIKAELPDNCSLQQINWAMLSVSYDAYIAHATAMK